MRDIWVNLGTHMYLVNDSGEVTGVLVPLDTQILGKQQRTFNEASKGFRIDGYEKRSIKKIS